MNDRIYDLKDVLKSLPAQASLDGLSVLCADTSGDLKKSNAAMLQIHSELVSGDLNDITGYGIYRLDSTGSNWPVTAGGLIMLHLNVYQLVFRAGDGGHLYFRVKSGVNGWEAWKTVV